MTAGGIAAELIRRKRDGALLSDTYNETKIVPAVNELRKAAGQ